MPVVEDSADGALLHIHVQPKSARTECAGIHGDAVKIRVAAPPVEGQANEELCRYLADRFGLAARDVVLRAGGASRRKRVLLKTVPASRVWEVLGIPVLPSGRRETADDR